MKKVPRRKFDPKDKEEVDKERDELEKALELDIEKCPKCGNFIPADETMCSKCEAAARSAGNGRVSVMKETGKEEGMRRPKAREEAEPKEDEEVLAEDDTAEGPSEDEDAGDADVGASEPEVGPGSSSGKAVAFVVILLGIISYVLTPVFVTSRLWTAGLMITGAVIIVIGSNMVFATYTRIMPAAPSIPEVKDVTSDELELLAELEKYPEEFEEEERKAAREKEEAEVPVTEGEEEAPVEEEAPEEEGPEAPAKDDTLERRFQEEEERLIETAPPQPKEAPAAKEPAEEAEDVLLEGEETWGVPKADTVLERIEAVDSKVVKRTGPAKPEAPAKAKSPPGPEVPPAKPEVPPTPATPPPKPEESSAPDATKKQLEDTAKAIEQRIEEVEAEIERLRQKKAEFTAAARAKPVKKVPEAIKWACPVCKTPVTETMTECPKCGTLLE